MDEEFQSSGGLVAPPVPLRRSPVAEAAAADDDDERCASYLELDADDMYDMYESADVVEPMRQRQILPGQKSMPESALPPVLMPRKQSCPDATTASRRPPRALPQSPPETVKPVDSTTQKGTSKPPPPPVMARKK